MDTTNTPAEGGSYEMVNGARVLVARTGGEGKRGTTDVCPALDAAELAALEADAAGLEESDPADAVRRRLPPPPSRWEG
jgi:hypothetical protein